MTIDINPEPTPHDDQSDEINHGVSAPEPAEGADDVTEPHEGSPQG